MSAKRNTGKRAQSNHGEADRTRAGKAPKRRVRESARGRDRQVAGPAGSAGNPGLSEEFLSQASLTMEQEIHAVLFLFAQPDTTITSIADTLKVSKKKVVQRLKQAFLSGTVPLPVADTAFRSPLHRLFPEVRIRIVPAKNLFPLLASLQVLTWLKECLEPLPDLDSLPGPDAADSDEPSRLGIEHRCPYVAIGGGKNMHAIVECIPQVLGSPIGREVREWLGVRGRFSIINATAGGQPLNPILESSQVATRLAQVTRQACGLYKVSRSQALVDENQLIRMAVRNTSVVVSGIGDKERAYCVEAMRRMEVWNDEVEKEVVGEFLFQTFDVKCQPYPQLLSQQIDTKEVSDTESQERPQEPMLARLLKFESLRGRPAANQYLMSQGGVPLPRWVIGVADCRPDTQDAKARAILTLLRNGYLSHLCVSAEVADAIVVQTFDEQRRNLPGSLIKQ